MKVLVMLSTDIRCLILIKNQPIFKFNHLKPNRSTLLIYLIWLILVFFLITLKKLKYSAYFCWKKPLHIEGLKF
ncbi:MAG: hypothetical protein CML16_16880 [Pusillimonas sp.]|nr:hypothetical protein [Pusillimonas sp.]MBC44051.1 hypothetical protein [Pusillimonas sp.]HCP79016.1 hypothetical protein [Pusillimonas sp.]